MRDTLDSESNSRTISVDRRTLPRDESWLSEIPNGQNVFHYWTTADEIDREKTLVESVQSWFDEIYDLVNRTQLETLWVTTKQAAIKKLTLTFPVSISSRLHSGPEQIGHFTQLIWGSSTKVGCGISTFICKAPDYTIMNCAVVVCNYKETGNYQEQPAYKSSPTDEPTCSKRYKLDEDTGLCHWLW